MHEPSISPQDLAVMAGIILASVLVSAIAMLPFQAPPEPGSLPRAVGTLVFFTTLTTLGALRWYWLRESGN